MAELDRIFLALKDLDCKMDEVLIKRLPSIEIKIAQLQVKSGLIGGLSGLLVALGVILTRLAIK